MTLSIDVTPEAQAERPGSSVRMVGDPYRGQARWFPRTAVGAALYESRVIRTKQYLSAFTSRLV